MAWLIVYRNDDGSIAGLSIGESVDRGRSASRFVERDAKRVQEITTPTAGVRYIVDHTPLGVAVYRD